MTAAGDIRKMDVRHDRGIRVGGEIFPHVAINQNRFLHDEVGVK
jgi:hypothetical protein